VCDLETSRMGAPYIYDISHLRVNGIYGLMVRSLIWSMSSHVVGITIKVGVDSNL